ncbi:hypothetical protein [Streptomyces buecherae]|uniref:hypothetical protein n=1 Tax=Streptomyces buecherae TaxID=2763006 RepID=UPI003684247C
MHSPQISVRCEVLLRHFGSRRIVLVRMPGETLWQMPGGVVPVRDPVQRVAAEHLYKLTGISRDIHKYRIVDQSPTRGEFCFVAASNLLTEEEARGLDNTPHPTGPKAGAASLVSEKRAAEFVTPEHSRRIKAALEAESRGIYIPFFFEATTEHRGWG